MVQVFCSCYRNMDWWCPKLKELVGPTLVHMDVDVKSASNLAKYHFTQISHLFWFFPWILSNCLHFLGISLKFDNLSQSWAIFDSSFWLFEVDVQFESYLVPLDVIIGMVLKNGPDRSVESRTLLVFWRVKTVCKWTGKNRSIHEIKLVQQGKKPFFFKYIFLESIEVMDRVNRKIIIKRTCMKHVFHIILRFSFFFLYLVLFFYKL